MSDRCLFVFVFAFGGIDIMGIVTMVYEPW